MDVNYPDQIVSLFATGMVITAVMEARRTGKGCFLDFSQREVASFTIGEEILAAAADPAHRPARRGNREDGVAQQDTYRCRDGRWIAVTLATPDPGLEAWCAATDSAEAVAGLLAKGIAGGAVPRRRGSAARQGAGRRDSRSRRARRAGEGPALSAGRARASRSSAPHPTSVSTPQRYCARCWATTTPSWTRSPRRA